MPAGTRRPIGELRDALRSYLAGHPDAADGLEGIRWWWLPSHLQGVGRERLHMALMDLVERNEMLCTTLPDGTELYARAAASRDAEPGAGRVLSIVAPTTTPPETKE
ncbi:hypothetical protein [Pseudoxanthomonas sp. 10H]|uniref:hypothetical protein n=1 Tax=Pseudoxanthomonas sp. 10H TaxID=3242729 RepID=UPI0035567EF4